MEKTELEESNFEEWNKNMNINEVTIAGNLTRNPELKYTPKGTAVCRVGVAINRKWTTESGEKKEDVVFVDVDFWGKSAESVAKFFTKGRNIYVRGRLKLDTWTDKESGKDRTRLGVIAESWQFADSRPNVSDAPVAPSKEMTATTKPQVDAGDDVPF